MPKEPLRESCTPFSLTKFGVATFQFKNRTCAPFTGRNTADKPRLQLAKPNVNVTSISKMFTHSSIVAYAKCNYWLAKN